MLSNATTAFAKIAIPTVTEVCFILKLMSVADANWDQSHVSTVEAPIAAVEGVVWGEGMAVESYVPTATTARTAPALGKSFKTIANGVF